MQRLIIERERGREGGRPREEGDSRILSKGASRREGGREGEREQGRPREGEDSRLLSEGASGRERASNQISMSLQLPAPYKYVLCCGV